MLRKITFAIAAIAAVLAFQAPAFAADEMKPFILASKASGSVDAAAQDASAKLTAAGFEIVGTYKPYDGATILVITNDALKSAAAQNEFGGFGVAQRVAITAVNGEIQVTYTNPSYMGPAYRMKADLSGVTKALQAALGDQGEFGPKDGMTDKELRKYHYMFGMEYFDEPSELVEYGSYSEAVAKVEAALDSNGAGVSKIARIDVPGREETYFAVAMKGDPQTEDKFRSDQFIMSEIDFKDLRSTAHLPYEIVVVGNTAYALYARFRIAVNFPDLSMMGSNSFMNIMESPEAIRKALVVAAGGEVEDKKHEKF